MKRNRKFIFIATLACMLVACLLFASCDLHLKHEYDDDWFNDETYHWKQCSICGKKSNKEKHSVPQDGWQVVREPSETQTGLRSGKCSVCQAVVEEEIGKLEHEHEFTGEYKSDNLGHWQVCSCGEKGSFAEHVVTDWIVDTEATENSQGLKRGVCEVCNAEVEKVIPVVGHTHSYSETLEYDDMYHYYECACGDKTDVVPHAFDGEWIKDADKHWKECVCGKTGEEQPHDVVWIVDKQATASEKGSKHEECSVCRYVGSTQEIPQIVAGSGTVDFYAVNDFHGEVDKITTVGGYLKQQTNSNANTVLISSGDMFQGSMESNSNYGKLLTDCMKTIGFDMMTLGNHEFDWGLDNLKNLSASSGVPFLGANIYDWDPASKTWGGFASDIAREYVVKTLDNGLKVGVIGVIGQNQITSISSNLVQTIGFKDPVPIIKQLSQDLKVKQSCDVVVVSAHTDLKGLFGLSSRDPEPTDAGGIEQYVDAVFLAHTHQQQSFTLSNIPFIQGGHNGSHISRIQLTVSNGNVECTVQSNISYSSSWPNLLLIDDMVNNSNAQIADERNRELAYLDGSLEKNPDMARLVSRAIAEYAKNQGYDIALAMVNEARTILSAGTVTYTKLYESLPFDNVVYIAKVKGSDIINEARYGNYFWRSSGEAIESNKYYMIAVIDYLLYHQNASRNYNYFPTAFTSGFTPVALSNDAYQAYNYRLITRDYLLARGSVNASDYSVDNNNTALGLLTSSVTLTYQTTGDWINDGSNPNPNPDPNPIPNPNPDPTPSLPTHAGTEDDPYDILDALYYAKQYSDKTNAHKGYIIGKVKIGSSAPKRGSSTDDLGNVYLIDDDGNEIYVYYLSMFLGAGKGNNWDWTDVPTGGLPNGIKEGDVLVIYANALYTYSGTGAQQISSGYCVSVNGMATA